MQNSLQVSLFINCCRSPSEDQVASIWKDSKIPLLSFVQQAYSHVHGVVTDGDGKALSSATLSFSGIQAVANTTSEGHFQKYLIPGKYTVTASMSGFQPVSKDVVISKTNPVKVDFSLIKEHHVSHHTYAELTDELKQLSEKYSQIAHLYGIGKSVQGRKLWVMEISDNPGAHESGEPEIRLIAGVYDFYGEF